MAKKKSLILSPPEIFAEIAHLGEWLRTMLIAVCFQGLGLLLHP